MQPNQIKNHTNKIKTSPKSCFCLKLFVLLVVSALFFFKIFFVKTGENFAFSDSTIVKEKPLNSTAIKERLELQLQIPNLKMNLKQNSETKKTSYKPNREAEKLAPYIPEKSDNYLLALKATAKSRFKRARSYLNDEYISRKEVEINNDDKELYNIYLLRGSIEFYDGNYKSALVWFQKSSNILPGNLKALNSIGLTLKILDQHYEADMIYKQALTDAKRKYGDKHPEVARLLNSIGELYYSQKGYSKAQIYFKQALNIFYKNNKKYKVEIAECLNNLAITYGDQKDYKTAEELLLQSLDERVNVWGEYHSDVAQSLINLADVYEEQKKIKEAEKLYVRAFNIYKRLGTKNAYKGICLNNLGELHLNRNELEKAEYLFKMAYKIFIDTIGAKHHYVAHVLFNFGKIYERREKCLKAKCYYQKAMTVVENLFGTGHYLYIEILKYYNNISENCDNNKPCEGSAIDSQTIKSNKFLVDKLNLVSTVLAIIFVPLIIFLFLLSLLLKHYKIFKNQQSIDEIMDYELGLNRLKELAEKTDGYLEFNTYEAQLLENLENLKHGDNGELKSNRSKIVERLNKLANKKLGTTFNDLCKKDYIYK